MPRARTACRTTTTTPGSSRCVTGKWSSSMSGATPSPTRLPCSTRSSCPRRSCAADRRWGLCGHLDVHYGPTPLGGSSMTTTAQVRSFDQLYIGGRWVDPSSGERSDTVSPSTEEPVNHVVLAADADGDAPL